MCNKNSTRRNIQCSCKEIKTNASTWNMKIRTAGWVLWVQACDSSTILQHAANSLQNYTATNRAAPLMKAQAC